MSLLLLHIITEYKLTLHNISLRLFRSVNTLNPKLKFKTILKQITIITESSVPLTFLRFAAKHCSIALTTLRRILTAIRSYMLHIPKSAKGN